MKIVVTGANGMLGSDVVTAGRLAGHEVTGLEHRDLDVTDAPRTGVTMEQLGPDLVINCAAWTDVDGAEQAEAEATEVNGAGAANVARAAAAAGAAVVYPSSDYVFDGRKDGPYVEEDAVNPISAYGRSKLAGERATAEANPRHYIARTAWLFGPNGKNFVETMLRLGEERDELLVVDDQLGSPTYTGHLSTAMIKLGARNDYGVHHTAGQGRTTWFGFAGEIFARTGIRCELRPGTTEEVPRPAPRPANSVLAKGRSDGVLLPSWKQGLAEYLERRAKEPG